MKKALILAVNIIVAFKNKNGSANEYSTLEIKTLSRSLR